MTRCAGAAGPLVASGGLSRLDWVRARGTRSRVEGDKRAERHRLAKLLPATSVDVTSAPNIRTETRVGVSDLSVMATSACARRSRGPQQKTLRPEYTSACRSAGPARPCRLD